MKTIAPIVYTYHEDESRPIKLDLHPTQKYSPATTSYKTAIVYHGGGLIGGNRRKWIPHKVVELLHEQDWIIISPDYHLLPESTISDIRSDIEALEQWLLIHHKEIGVDLNRISLVGASAGSFVSILTSAFWKSLRPKAFLNLFGMANTTGAWYKRKKDWSGDHVIFGIVTVSSLKAEDFEVFFKAGRKRIWNDEEDTVGVGDRSGLFCWLLYQGKLSALCDGTLTRPWEVVESIDPINLLTPSFPPTISLHGDKDSVAPISDSEIFTDTLTELGVETEFLVIPGAEHGLYPDEEYLSYFEKGVAFLERQV